VDAVTAGQLRDRLTLEQASKTPTGDTGMTTVYLPVEVVWGEVRGVREQAFAETVAVSGGATHVIRIRWRTRAGFDHVGGDAGRRWRVEGIRDPDNKRRYLDMFCTELQPEDET